MRRYSKAELEEGSLCCIFHWELSNYGMNLLVALRLYFLSYEKCPKCEFDEGVFPPLFGICQTVQMEIITLAHLAEVLSIRWTARRGYHREMRRTV